MNFDERAKELVSNIADLEERDEDFWVACDAAMHELRAAYVAGLRRAARIANEQNCDCDAIRAAFLIHNAADKVESGEGTG
jgi:hypothetical protein